jgi:hypothetical protein
MPGLEKRTKRHTVDLFGDFSRSTMQHMLIAIIEFQGVLAFGHFRRSQTYFIHASCNRWCFKTNCWSISLLLKDGIINRHQRFGLPKSLRMYNVRLSDSSQACFMAVDDLRICKLDCGLHQSFPIWKSELQLFVMVFSFCFELQPPASPGIHCSSKWLAWQHVCRNYRFLRKLSRQRHCRRTEEKEFYFKATY